MTTTTSTVEHRIYVASLSDYNAGILHGVWIDLDFKNSDDIQKEVDAMLAESPTAKKEDIEAEEWAIHDSEGINIDGESCDFEKLVEEVDIRNNVGDDAWDGYISMVGVGHGSIEEFEDVYRGMWESEEEYAENFFNECEEPLSDMARQYFNWKAYASDMFINDMYSYEAGYHKVYVYSRS